MVEVLVELSLTIAGLLHLYSQIIGSELHCREVRDGKHSLKGEIFF